MTITACDNPARWHPTIHRDEDHHNPPKSWTSDGGASSDVWQLCGLCHNETHALLNEYVRARGVPSWEIRRTYGLFVRRLATEAWARRPNDKPPYTTARGEGQ